MTETEQDPEAPKTWDKVTLVRHGDQIFGQLRAKRGDDLWGCGAVISKRDSISYRANSDREQAEKMADFYDRLMEVFKLEDMPIPGCPPEDEATGGSSPDR